MWQEKQNYCKERPTVDNDKGLLHLYTCKISKCNYEGCTGLPSLSTNWRQSQQIEFPIEADTSSTEAFKLEVGRKQLTKKQHKNNTDKAMMSYNCEKLF